MNSARQINKFPLYRVVITHLTQGIAWIVWWCITHIVYSIRVCGVENLKNTRAPVIFAANHTSDMDSIFIRTCLPFFSQFAPLFAVARTRKDYQWKGWRRFFYTDWFFALMGAYPVHRGRTDYAKSLATHVSIAQQKQNLLIFSGGKQDTIEEYIKPHGGTGYLAWKTNLPVVPVMVRTVRRKRRKTDYFTRRIVYISYGKAIRKDELFSTDTPAVQDFQDATAKVIHRIVSLRGASAIETVVNVQQNGQIRQQAC